MNEQLKEIRKKYYKKYPNCLECVWMRYNSPSSMILGLDCNDYLSCELKDKIIHFPKIQARLCKWYNYKEEK